MVVTDARLLKGRDPVEACRRAVAGGKGATIIQVRLKDAPPRELLALSHALVSALAVPVIVNDRVDVALAAGAAGAHLGQEDPPLDRLRPQVPPGFLLGVSVGSDVEAERLMDQAMRRATEQGFTPATHRLDILGLCARCAATEPA